MTTWFYVAVLAIEPMVDSIPSMNAMGMTGTSRARLIDVQLVDLDLFSGL